jgi:hypothetical protein
MIRKLAIAAAVTVSVVALLVFTVYLLLLRGLGDWGYGPGVHDFSAQLAGGYALCHTSGIDIVVTGPRGIEIPATVEELAYDPAFIIAKQEQLRPRFENDDRGDPIPGKFNYWIVDISHSKHYGPLDEPHFLVKRRDLKVDPGLTLRRESSFDPRNNQ